jgi:O-antigen/teichoic acid export membrane protein
VAKSSAGMGDSLLLLTAAKVWVTALAILAVPVYLHYLGLEAFGIIGFFSALQSAMVVFDFGLSATLTKKLAQLNDSRYERVSARNLMRSAEAIYFFIGLAVVILLWLLSGALSLNWSLGKTYSYADITLVVLLAASSLAVLWPTALYSSALTGLNAIKSLAIATSILALLRLGLSVLTAIQTLRLEYFFAAQLIGSAIQIFWLRKLSWKHLGLQGHVPQFSKQSLGAGSVFTSDMALIAIFSIILTQGDKLLLSQLLSLSDFGVYSLASMAAAGLYVLINPFFSVLFPHFSRLIAKGDKNLAGLAYKQSSELLSCLLLPLSFVLVVFPYQVLWVWSGNAEVSHKAAGALAFIAAGTTINGLLVTPYSYQLAAGITKLSLVTSGLALFVTVPALWIFSASHGLIGAAFVWFAVNLGLLIVWPFWMHQYILKEHMLWWYGRAIIVPIAVGLLTSMSISWFTFNTESRLGMGLVLCTILIANFFLLLTLLPLARSKLFSYVAAKINVKNTI